MILVDTNVLVDVVEDDAQWAEWSVQALRAQAQAHELAINVVVYAEFSLAFRTIEALERAVAELGLKLLEIPRPALFLAGKAFLRYRQAGGVRSNVLPDFFIGAHASVAGMALLTRDAARYRSYFPALSLLTP